MSEFRFILNGTTLKNHPGGWEDFEEAIVRNEEVHGITLEYSANLTFVGDGYQIVEQAYQDSYCAEMNLIVQQKCSGGNFEKILDLLLKISDIDTNLNKCTAEVKLTDDSYYGMIHNNREVIVPLLGTLSKNGEPIAACPTISFKTFLPTLSGGQVDFMEVNRTGYDHKEALAYVLRHITDGRVAEVESDYLDSLGFNPDPEIFDVDISDAQNEQTMGFVLISGYNIRIGGAGETALDVRVTFLKLVETLFTKHGLFWAIEDGKFRIEPVDYFFTITGTEGASFVAESQTDVKRSIQTERLYSAVDFGSEIDLADRELVYAMPYVDLISHQQQRYNLTGVCNTDTVLNLVRGYPYDSNIIEDIIQTQINAETAQDIDQSRDQDVFYIQYFRFDSGETADNLYYAAFSGFFLRPNLPEEPTGVVYNPYLFNSEIAKRHKVQSDYSFYLTDNDDNFQVSSEQGNTYANLQSFLMPSVANSGQGSNSFLNDFMDAFGFPYVPDMSQGSWGGFMNNSDINITYPVGGSPPALKLPYTDDTTGNNFNPNGNWNIVDKVFTAPSTGVYGFDVNTVINKVVDRVQQNGIWYNTHQSTPSNRRLIRPRNFNAYIYAVYYDEFDNLIDFEWIQPPNPFDAIIEFDVTEGRIVRNYDSFNQSYLNQPGQMLLSQALENMVWDYAENCTPNYPNNYNLNTPFITHMDVGQKMAIMVYTESSYHIDNVLLTGQRQVQYSVLPESNIFTNYFITGGGAFAPVDVDSNYATLYKFERPITIERWLEIRSNPKKPIFVSPTAENFIRGYGSRITRNFYKGSTDFELIGNRKQPNF